MKSIRRRFYPQAELKINLPEALTRILQSRGIAHANELKLELDQLLPFDQLSNIQLASQLLADALRAQQRIVIIGDFDVDGATATTLSLLALKSFGAKNVDFLVPNRFAYGYGLTPEIVDVALAQKPDLIMTVDNGSSHHAGVNHAKAHGIQVLVTDHHLCAEPLPAADAIVNPNLPQDQFLSKNLAGVGVAFYVMLALRAELRQREWFSKQNIPEPTMTQFLDLVALGTVADVVKLDRNNRILVHHGLARIKASQCRPGISALLKIARRDPQKLRASDLGFAIAPRLNAAGRLDDMAIGIKCLLAENENQALHFAHQLETLNSERMSIEKEMQSKAHELLQHIHEPKKPQTYGICLYDEHWHQGVIGILASRLKDRYEQPTIIFANHTEDKLKGSARSIPELHIRDLLTQIAVKYPDLIQQYGGHAMAAGLTIAKHNFQQFQKIYMEELGFYFNHEFPSAVIDSDGALEEKNLNMPFAELLDRYGPWGTGFPEPVFDDVFTILDQKIVGEKHLKLILQRPNARHPIHAIHFQTDLQHWPNHRIRQAHIVYKLNINEYLGNRSLQLLVEQMMPVAESVDR